VCFTRRISEYEQWKTRKLAKRYVYAFADGTYFTVIYNDEGCKMPILAVVGIAENGERDVLAFSVGDRENEQVWKDLLEDLKQRGVKAIDLWVSDGNQAMLNAITKKFPDSARQRCVIHKMDNVLSYVPTKQQEQLKPELKALFYQKDRQAADQAVAAFIEKYQKMYPTAIACFQRDLEACLTFYAFPKSIGRPFAPTMSWSGSSAKSSGAPIKWPQLFAPKGVVYCCFMRSSAVCTSTNSRFPLHQPSNQTPRFYTTLDKLPVFSSSQNNTQSTSKCLIL